MTNRTLETSILRQTTDQSIENKRIPLFRISENREAIIWGLEKRRARYQLSSDAATEDAATEDIGVNKAEVDGVFAGVNQRYEVRLVR